MRPVAFVLILIGLLTTSGRPAGADCLGPTIEAEQLEVERGEELVVTGYAWGDNCYDTGPPPDGEGPLGIPIDGIEISLVQGADEWLVATGAADDDYLFEVTVVVPSDLRPGEAVVRARWDSRRADSMTPPILVTDAAPSTSVAPSVATFAPDTTLPVAPTTAVTSVAPPSTEPATTAASGPTMESASTTEVSSAPGTDLDGAAEETADSSDSAAVPVVIGIGLAAGVAVLVAMMAARRRSR